LIQRDLHLIAERLLFESEQVDVHGWLRHGVVEIDHVIEGHLGLEIVGSERRGILRLPSRKLATIDLEERRIIVRKRLMNDLRREGEYRQVIAHEAGHAIIHADVAKQTTLPFVEPDVNPSGARKPAFSSPRTDERELEANVFGALVLIPMREFFHCVQPIVRSYVTADWTRISARGAEAEERAATQYREDAVAALCLRFQASPSVAKIALAYWHGLDRPPRSWQINASPRSDGRRSSIIGDVR